MEMKWWLITWTTYASWLPGDPRGFRTRRGKEYVPPPRRYTNPGEPTYDPREYSNRFQNAKASTETCVKLTPPQQRIVMDAVISEIDAIPITSAIASVGSTHIHWLALFGDRPIRTTVGRIKSQATHRLNTAGFDGKRPWSKNCDMKSKTTDHEFRSAFHYIHRHTREGCLIHVWSRYQADDFPSVP